MTVQITTTGSEIRVVSPYDARFVKFARELSGKFDRNTSAWVFNARYEERVREALTAIYGTDGTPVPTVTLHVHLDGLGPREMKNELRVAGRTVLYKSSRDVAPRVSEGAAVITGALKSYGGSARSPQITFEDGTVVEVLNVPQTIAAALVEQNPDAYRIVVEAQPEGSLTPAEMSLVAALSQLAPERLQLVLQAIQQQPA